MKKTQRRCQICAELVKQDATKCRSCGSTLLATGAWTAPPEPKSGADAVGGWVEATVPGDVGAAGVAVVAGALLGYAVGAWLDPAVHPIAVLVGAAAGGAAARLRGGP